VRAAEFVSPALFFLFFFLLIFNPASGGDGGDGLVVGGLHLSLLCT
jgi:hypothetical protein